ncbi:TPA: hypothetical protein R0C45_003182 [Kluyvera ascorbata F0526]|nr:hypothetical protein [Kluyvera ascorbata F0526]
MASADDSFLRDEYLKLQDQYEDYDRRALQIKGWLAATSITGFALGTDPSKGVGSFTFVAIALMALCFWYLEATWKTFQYAIAERIRTIEIYFQNGGSPPMPFQIYHAWFHSYSKNRRRQAIILWKAGRQPFVHLPYSLIIFLCLILLVHSCSR